MNLRILVKAIVIAALPATAGWVMGSLPINHPRAFMVTFLGILLAVAFLGYRQYADNASAVMSVEANFVSELRRVTATALLCISFHFSFWTALAYSADLGILRPGMVIATSTAILAAIALWVGRAPTRNNYEKPDCIVRSGQAPLPTCIRESLSTQIPRLVTQANRSAHWPIVDSLPSKSQ